MSTELYLAFVAATVVLMLIPGPNVALIVANSVAHGPRYGLATVAGTSSATVLQLAVTALGMASLLAALGDWLQWVRWIGVAYLLYLGFRIWRSAPVDLTTAGAEPRSMRAIFARGLLVSLANPKTLLFYGAFLPQFVAPEAGVGWQLAALSATVLAIAVVVDSGWALLAGRFRGVLAVRGRLRNRVTGGLLIAAGVGLASARRA